MDKLLELKAAHELADLVEASGVRLHGAGRVRQGICPFHDEKEGSFTVYTDTQRFYCFGCKAKGDVIDYVQMRMGLSFNEALDYLGRIPGTGSSTPKGLVKKERLDPNILTHAMRFYASELKGSDAGIEYLEGRGVDRKTMVRLGLGYGAGPGLRDYLVSGGYSHNDIRASGLYTGEGQHRFANMIVVPEIEERLVVYITGRAIANNQTPRFQGLPGERPLLGWGRLEHHRWVILTEGVFDWLLLTTWGYPACATMGAQNSVNVALTLSPMEYVFLVFDNDEAGRASVESLKEALTCKVIEIPLPENIKDIAELASRGYGRRMFHDSMMEAINATQVHARGKA